MNVDFGNETRSRYESHKSFISWLDCAKDDKRITFESTELTANIFYGMVEGCIIWNALLTDGESVL